MKFSIVLFILFTFIFKVKNPPNFIVVEKSGIVKLFIYVNAFGVAHFIKFDINSSFKPIFVPASFIQ